MNTEATKTVQIAGEKFDLHVPFMAGDVLDDAAARQLNQVRLENIGNNFRKRVNEANGDPNVLATLRTEIADYDARYTFSMLGAGGSRTVRDPIEREARDIARTILRVKLSKESPPRKLKDVPEEKLEAAIEQVSQKDEVIREAKKRVAAKQKFIDTSLEGVEIGA